MSEEIDESSLPYSQQVLLAKQREYTGLSELKAASDALVERVEKLAEMGNVMADGGEGECAGFRCSKASLFG